MKIPRHIGSGISAVLRQLGLGAKLRQYEVLEAWPRVVGENIARISTAESIRDGKLFVSVVHSVWRNELIFLKKEIIEKLNKEMNQEIVKDIIFR